MNSPVTHRLTLTAYELALVIKGLRLASQRLVAHPEECRETNELTARLEGIYRARDRLGSAPDA